MIFKYEAVDNAGKSIVGQIEADNLSQARNKVRGLGLLPIKINVVNKVNNALKENNTKLKTKNLENFVDKDSNIKLKHQQLEFFTSQLSILLTAGVVLLKSLDSLIAQAKNNNLLKVLLTLKNKLNEGNTLSKAMSIFPRTFSKVYCALVKSGERIGNLDEVLGQLGDFLKQERLIRSQVLLAMIYPAVLLMVAVIIIGILLVFVIPSISEQFTDFDVELPLITLILINISNFIINWGLVLLGVLIALIIVLRYFINNLDSVKFVFHNFLLGLPIIGKLILNFQLARFCNLVSSLCKGGVQLLEALKIAHTSLSNIVISKEIAKLADLMESGSNLSYSMNKSKIFPPVILQMVVVGEESGKLGDLLNTAGMYYNDEFSRQVKTLLSLLEPMIILIMGGMILVLVLSIMLPILQLNNLVGNL